MLNCEQIIEMKSEIKHAKSAVKSSVNCQRIEFEFVTTINLESSPSCKCYTYTPQCRYNNQRELPLHSHGGGAFCRFRIPKENTASGVYIIKSQQTILYIGMCVNLAQRFNSGYGQISPRNCYVGGRQTNCRINKLILSEIKSGAKLKLYFHKTKKYKQLEACLITSKKPKWNLTGS